jgi:gas vesicle protein
MSDRNDDFGAFLVGVIVGGMAGAIAALLLAPQSGEETRTMIKDKAIELRDIAEETIEETVAKAETTARETVKQAESTLKQAKERAAEITKKGQVLLEEQKEKITGKKPKEDKAS